MKKLSLEELNRVSAEAFKTSPKIPVVVVLDSIRSALNVGSVFRTADAFAVEKIILCGITAQPPHPEILKTAIGATESVDWLFEKEIRAAAAKLKNEGYKILAVEQTDESVFLQNLKIQPAEKLALIFGNEVGGVSDPVLPLLDGAIEIPQFGAKHSINVAVCVGIVLWEILKTNILNLENFQR